MALGTRERRIVGRRKMADETGERRIAGRRKMEDETGERRIAGRRKMADETEEKRIARESAVSGQVEQMTGVGQSVSESHRHVPSPRLLVSHQCFHRQGNFRILGKFDENQFDFRQCFRL